MFNFFIIFIYYFFFLLFYSSAALCCTGPDGEPGRAQGCSLRLPTQGPEQEHNNNMCNYLEVN